MILKLIGRMGFFGGAIFGVSVTRAFSQIFEISHETHGWNILDWELAELGYPSGIWTFLIAATLAYAWRKYRLEIESDRRLADVS